MPRRGETIIRKWKFEKDRREIEIPVKLVDAVQYSGRPEKPEHFKVDLDEFDIHEKSQNLTMLRKRVFALLDDKIGLTWEPWLHITVSGDAESFPISDRAANLNESVRINLDIGVEPILLATTPEGRKMNKGHRKGVRGFGHAHERREFVHGGWPEVKRVEAKRSQTGAFRLNASEVSALVPDTPANRAAINLLSSDLGRLANRLLDLFENERAQETLSNASSTLLLTAPEGDLK